MFIRATAGKAEAGKTITVGSVYRHKKGNVVTVTENTGKLVKYTNKDGTPGVMGAWIFADLVKMGDFEALA
jgi:isoaspartyl peptidase/L-asparaginase-like protein (Ntn-hydrolase superfamily)